MTEECVSNNSLNYNNCDYECLSLPRSDSVSANNSQAVTQWLGQMVARVTQVICTDFSMLESERASEKEREKERERERERERETLLELLAAGLGLYMLQPLPLGQGSHTRLHHLHYYYVHHHFTSCYCVWASWWPNHKCRDLSLLSFSSLCSGVERERERQGQRTHRVRVMMMTMLMMVIASIYSFTLPWWHLMCV